MSALDERYQRAIKKHLEFPGLHGFKTVHKDRADTEGLAAAASPDGTYFYLRSEGKPSDRRYFCRYGNTTEAVTNPSASDVRKLEEATPLPIVSMWGVVEGNRVVELYWWYAGPTAFQRVMGPPEVLAVVCKEHAQGNLMHELWKPGKLLDIPTFWRLVAKKKLVPVAGLLRSKGHIKLCGFRIAGMSAEGVLANGNLLLRPEAWKHAPEITSANASETRPVVIAND